ncbi:MAG: hypothetical protein OEY49_15045 [Candidatus Heimdallarchaeota archaeon]|nr:hypothetical protein [Candidatus Heimdallarchaeota archaeon]
MITSKNIIQSPIIEGKLLFLASIFTLVAVLFATISMFISSEDLINETSITLIKIGWLSLGPFTMLITFAFMLPNFKSSYFDILQLTIIVSINVTLSIILFISVDVVLIEKGIIRIIFSPLDTVVFTISTGIFIFYLIKRLYQVKKIQNKYKEYFSTKILFSTIILSLITIFTTFTTLNLKGIKNPIENKLPGFSFFIPLSFVFVIIGYYFYKDVSYPFIIPVKIYGVIFADHQTGITLISKDYQSDIPAMNLLGNLMTTLNLSLQDTIKSNQSMEDIIFGDKVIHITSGQFASCIVIVSKNSLITKSITKYLCKKFESQFKELIEVMREKPRDVTIFNSFEHEFQKVRKYLI